MDSLNPLHAIILAFAAAFWIFVLWMLWIIAKSLKSIGESLKEIARESQNRT